MNISIYILIGIFILTILCLYILGGLISKALKIYFNSDSTQGFFQLSCGLSVTFTGYSLVQTGGKTFSLLLLVVLLSSLLYHHLHIKGSEIQKEKKLSDFFNWQYFLSISGFGVVILLINYIISTQGLPTPYFWTVRDEIFYSQIAGFLNHTGKESYLVDWIDHADQINTAPYHYPEIWFTALLSKITGLLDLQVHIFLTNNVLYSLMGAGVLALLSENNPSGSKLQAWIILGLVFWIGPLLIGLTGEFEPVVMRLNTNPKAILPFCSFIWSYLAFQKKEFTLFTLSLFALPVFNYSFLPVIMATIPVAYIFYQWIRPGFFQLKFSWVGGVLVIYILTLIFVLRGDSEIRGLTDLGLTELKEYYSLGWRPIKGAIHYGLLTARDALNQIAFLLVVWLFLKWKTLQQDWKQYLDYSFFILMALAAFAGATILYFAMDTIQMYRIVYLMVLSLFLINIVQEIIQRPKAFILKGLFVFISLFFFYQSTFKFNPEKTRLSRYSNEYLIELKDNISFFKGQGVRFLPDSYYETAYNINPNCNFEGYALSYLRNTVIIHTLSVFGIKDREEYNDYFNANRDRILSSSYFVRYAQNRKREATSIDMEEIQVEFIKEHKISFVIAFQNESIPERIRGMYKKSLEDPASGEKIYYDANFL